MEVRLLGPVTVTVDGRSLDLGPRKRRLLLAVLALEVGRTVSVERLIDVLWGEDPPSSARRIVIVHVSRLREAFEGAGTARFGVSLATIGSGYALQMDPRRIDAHRFRALVASAATVADPGERVGLLRSALDLWRGPAIQDVSDDASRERLAGGLNELRLSAIEDRIELDLRAGRHAEVSAELAELTETHPGRERLTGHLMLAAYRAGRQSDALGVYERLRHWLSDEYGVDPGAGLRALFERILRADPDLDLSVSPPSRAPVAGGSLPRQLPAAARGFIGRDDAIAELDGLIAGADPPLVVIHGMAGVGKTALAVRWAHRVAHLFPDGQLFANLYGYAAAPPVSASDVLTQFLRALGVPPADVPIDVEEAGRLYRSVLAERRLLILLDNVSSPEHVRTLSPAAPGCIVVATSRHRMTGLAALDDAYLLPVETLRTAEAVDVLKVGLGGELVTASTDVVELAELCDGLPLALRIAAANFDAGTDGSVGDYVSGIRKGGTLASLATSGDDRATLAAVFSWSYRHLEASAAQAFRQLGAQPLREWDVFAAAAALGLPVADASSLVDSLAAAHLVERVGPERFAMHDLLAAYADELEPTESASRRDVLIRLVAYHRAAASVAMDVYAPNLRHRRPVVEVGDIELRGLPKEEQALAWLGTETTNLVRVVLEAHGAGLMPWAADLTRTIQVFLHETSRSSEAIVLFDALLGAASIAGDRAAEGVAEHGLGRVAWAAGRLEAALDHFGRAAAARSAAGDAAGLAATQNMMGIVYELQGDYVGALAVAAHVREAFRQAGDRWSEASALNNMGEIHRKQCRYADAAAHYGEALEIARTLADESFETTVLGNLGIICELTMRYDEALQIYRRVLVYARQSDSPTTAARMYCGIGSVHIARGELAAAEEALGMALDLTRTTAADRTEVAVRWHLGELSRHRGQLDAAMLELRQAARMSSETKYPMLAAQIACELGRCHLELGDRVAAAAEFGRAHAMSIQLAEPDTEAEALSGLGDVALVAGDRDVAERLARRAVELAVASGRREIEMLARRGLANALRSQGRVAEAAANEAEVRAAEDAAGIRRVPSAPPVATGG